MTASSAARKSTPRKKAQPRKASAAKAQPVSVGLDLDTEEYTEIRPAEPPVDFRIAGQVFTCRDDQYIPFGMFHSLMAMGEAGEAKDSGGVVVQIGPFFENCLMPDSWKRFEPLLNQSGGPVNNKHIEKLMQYISTKVLGFPMSPVSESPTGSGTTPPTSEESSSSQGRRAS